MSYSGVEVAMALVLILMFFVALAFAAATEGADSRPTIADRPARSI